MELLKKRPYWIVVLLWLLFQTIWFLHFRFNFEYESLKYIGEASYLSEHHHFSQSRYLFYLVTIAVIQMGQLSGIGLYGSLIVLLFINLIGYLYFFKAVRRRFSSTGMGLLATAFLLAFWPYQVWSLSLFSENIFYSLVMLFVAHLLLYEKLNFRFLAMMALLLLLLIVSRPLGILFIFPSLLFVFFLLRGRQRFYFLLSLVVAVMGMVAIVQVVFTTTSDWSMQRAFLDESLICDIPAPSGVAQDLPTHGGPLTQLLYYITHNFSHFAGLALTRLRYFFLLTRTYYSRAHNAYLLINMLLLYAAALWGFRRARCYLGLPGFLFCLSVIALFALAIAVQCDDYHNRFILTLMPVFTVLALAGLAPFLRKGFRAIAGPGRTISSGKDNV